MLILLIALVRVGMEMDMGIAYAVCGLEELERLLWLLLVLVLLSLRLWTYVRE
jgi:hypothetical protein